MHTDLTRRFLELAEHCDDLTPNRRAEVFARTPHLTDLNPCTLIPPVDGLDAEELLEHVECLKGLSRHLSVCENRLSALIRDP